MHDGTELSHAHGLGTLLHEDLGESATELTTVTGFLSGFPGRELKANLGAGLASLLHHLGDGVTTSEVPEVLEVDVGALDDTSLFAHRAGGTWLGSRCARIATHSY